ncbi:MAG TPA: hypothetical protein VFI47_07825 [Acidimicrobiales bacterium]|nr:hypothetical protein [Acidimicrobiales bacterium]
MRLRATRGDGASTLMLMPAGLLVVLIMASIAVDMSVVQLRQRQAHDLASAAANDAATAAADQVALRAGTYVADEEVADAVVIQVVMASELAPLVVGTPDVQVTADGVEVELAIRAEYVFAGVMPGAPDGTTVRATATGRVAGVAG